MHDLLIAGLPDHLTSTLAKALPDVTIRHATNSHELHDAIESRSWTALLIDHELEGDRTPALLRELREKGSLPSAILYTMPRSVPAHVARELVDSSGVRELLFHPLDPRELLRVVSATLGITSRSRATPAEAIEARKNISSAIAAIWERFRDATLARVTALDEVAVELLDRGTIEAGNRRHAEREAHKLAGGVGTFGFAEGSRIARAIELLMQGNAPFAQQDALRISELVVALRRELERPAQNTRHDAFDVTAQTTIAIITDDAEFADRVTMEAEGRRISCRWVKPDAQIMGGVGGVILDLSGSLAGDAGLLRLDALASTQPTPELIVIGERDDFTMRIETARRGARTFLRRPVPPPILIDTVANALRITDVAGSRVLVVDDDAQVLDALRVLLERRGMEVTTLSDPLSFWDALERTRPDILLLDEDMPHVSGVELCRVVRADPRWRLLPILFLSSRSDPASIQRFFNARADDYAPKPFAGPEVLARVESHLERARLRNALGDGESGTAGSQRRVQDDVATVLKIAARTRAPLSFAVLRIDEARELRAELAPTVWDAVVTRIREVLCSSLRQSDIVSQASRDEFVVVMYDADRDTAVDLLERILARVHGEEIPVRDRAMLVSYRGGVAEFGIEGTTYSQLYQAACDAVEVANASGGARIVGAGQQSTGQRAEVVDVAIVEDDPALATLLLHALSTRGMTVRWIRDGDEAWEKLSGARPTLRAGVILLDVDLPGRDGFTVLQALANNGVAARSKVIMLTVRASETEIVKALEMGAADHVAKPFSMQVLMRRIQRALGNE